MDCIGIIYSSLIKSENQEDLNPIMEKIYSFDASSLKLISSLIKPLSELTSESLILLSKWYLPKILSILYNNWDKNIMWITGLLQVS